MAYDVKIRGGRSWEFIESLRIEESESNTAPGADRITAMEQEDDKGQQEISYLGVKELFADPNEGLSEFQCRVRHVLRVGRIQNVSRDPYM